MFTGIVQTMGTVQAIQPESAVTRLTIAAPDLVRPIAHGSSIAVNGVCLTVTADAPPLVSFDVIPETLARSTLGRLTIGHRVNLERSLRAGDPLDGHIVQGHVDGTAVVRRIDTEANGYVVTFEADAALMPYIVPKGSIAIDGVSLTIAAVPTPDTFTVALIPTTLEITTLGLRRVGDVVNIETDILARTVVHTLERWQSGGAAPALTLANLRENGW
jgi:riboflavin synthase